MVEKENVGAEDVGIVIETGNSGIEFNFEEVEITEHSVSYHDEASRVVKEIQEKIGMKLHPRLVNWRSSDHRKRALERGYQPVKWEHLKKIPSAERAQFIFDETPEGLVSYQGSMVLMVCKEEAFLRREKDQVERTKRQATAGAEGRVRAEVERSLESDLSKEDIKGLSVVEKSGLFRAAAQTARGLRVSGMEDDQKVTEEELKSP